MSVLEEKDCIEVLEAAGDVIPASAIPPRGRILPLTLYSVGVLIVAEFLQIIYVVPALIGRHLIEKHSPHAPRYEEVWHFEACRLTTVTCTIGSRSAPGTI